LDDVSRRLKPGRYRQGEVIIREGDPGYEMFFIESGLVQVVRGTGSRTLLLAELGGGDVFGEMALLTGLPRSATVTALSDVDVWAMPQTDFDELVAAYPNLALALSRLLSERLRSTDERFLSQPGKPPAVPIAAAAAVAVPRPAAEPVAQPRPVRERVARPKPVPKKPTRKLTAELGESFEGAVTWFGSLSRGAKIRLVLFTLLVAWLLCIAAPVLVISTLAADDVTNLQGAIAFVQVETPVPTEAPLPTETASPPAVELSVPVESEIQPIAEVVAEAPVAAPMEPAQAEPSSTDTAEPMLLTEVPATATPWIIVITNTPPPPTDTPVPTDTPIPPTAAPAPPRVVSAAAPVLPTPIPEHPQPARNLDSRLAALNVNVEPAGVPPGQSYWRLVAGRWENEAEAGGGHSIFIDVLDEGGNKLVGVPIEIRWVGGGLTVFTEEKPANEYWANFPMYNTLGSYSVGVAGLPSDRIVGLGLGTVDQPQFKVHTNFFLTFQRVRR
jgi:CRP-like cAMP-binding protein